MAQALILAGYIKAAPTIKACANELPTRRKAPLPPNTTKHQAPPMAQSMLTTQTTRAQLIQSVIRCKTARRKQQRPTGPAEARTEPNLSVYEDTAPIKPKPQQDHEREESFLHRLTYHAQHEDFGTNLEAPSFCGVVGQGAEFPAFKGPVRDCGEKVAAAGTLSVASGAAFKGILTGFQHAITGKPLPANMLGLWSGAGKIGLAYGGSRMAINSIILGANEAGGIFPVLAPVIGGSVDALALGRNQHIADARDVFKTNLKKVSKCATLTLAARDISSQAAAFLLGPIAGASIANAIGVNPDSPVAKIFGGFTCSILMTPLSVATNRALESQLAELAKRGKSESSTIRNAVTNLSDQFSSLSKLREVYSPKNMGRSVALCGRAAAPVLFAGALVEGIKSATA